MLKNDNKEELDIEIIDTTDNLPIFIDKQEELRKCLHSTLSFLVSSACYNFASDSKFSNAIKKIGQETSIDMMHFLIEDSVKKLALCLKPKLAPSTVIENFVLEHNEKIVKESVYILQKFYISSFSTSNVPV